MTPEEQEQANADTADIAISIAVDIVEAIHDRPWVTWDEIVEYIQAIGFDDACKHAYEGSGR